MTLAKDYPPYDTLNALLAYDPKYGSLKWRVHRGPRARPGDDAGSVSEANGGHVVVGLDGRKYMAQYLAYIIATGHPPEHPLRLLDRKDDLRMANIIEAPAKATPKAAAARRYARTYRNKIRDAREHERRQMPPVEKDNSRVMYMTDTQSWHLLDMHTDGRVRPIARFKDEYTALVALETHAMDMRWLANNPPPEAVQLLKDGRRQDPHAGTGINLYSARQMLGYNPDTGSLIWRQPESRRGLDAVARTLRHRRQPSVMILGRYYPAGMLAWFLHRGVWPPRKTIGYRDGNPTNLRWTNLYRKDLEDKTNALQP